MYYLYILRCSDRTLYTGTTADLARRVGEHNSSKLCAKYTRARRPVQLVYSKRCHSRAKALSLEAKIKGLSRLAKLALIRGKNKI